MPNSSRPAIIICQVCCNDENNRRDAVYMCPKCRMPYCSVACYRNHQERCTESFYQERVSQVLQLEVKERKDDMMNMLQKFHNEQRNNNNSDPMQFLQVDNSYETWKENESKTFSTQELRQLWESLEHCMTEEEWETLVQSSLQVQSALVQMKQDQCHGQAHLEEWCLEPWHPWWTPELVLAAGTTHCSDEEEEQQQQEEKDFTPVITEFSLDDCILHTPAFSTIMCHSNTNSTVPLPHPSIPFNLIDILYSIVVTLRLYHGVENSVDVPQEAAATMVQHSIVLQQSDWGFDSLAAVLLFHQNNKNQHYRIALDDIVVVMSNHRLVARALWEGQQILHRVKKMRRLAKKMIYYRSWSLAHIPHVQQLAKQIEHWVVEKEIFDGIE